MTAAQQRAIRKREVAKRLDRIGASLLGALAEVERVECPVCEQRSLHVNLYAQSIMIVCETPMKQRHENESGDGGPLFCDFEHRVLSVSESMLPAVKLRNVNLTAPKCRRRRVTG